MSNSKKILIIYGSLNSVPSPEGAAPAKVIYETVTSFENDYFRVLSNCNDNLNGTIYNRQLFLHVKSNIIDLFLFTLLKIRFPYKRRREKFITGKKEQLIYYISVCRFLLFNKHDKIIVHVGIGLVAMIKMIFPKKKVIFYHHGTSLHSKLNENQWRALMKNSIAIFGVNDIALTKANDTFISKFESSRYFKINNAIIQESIGESLDPDSFKNIDTNKFKFAFSGRICIEKGVLNLLKAFKVVCKKDKNTCLYIIGAAGTKGKHNKLSLYFQECISFAKENNLPVIFTGFLSNIDLFSMLSKVDVVVCPTDIKLSEEGMPLSIIEAFSLSKPVIATNSGGNCEVVIDGENGLLVKSYPYIEELSDELLKLSSDPLLYNKLSAGAYHSFKNKHTYNQYNEEFKRALTKVRFINELS